MVVASETVSPDLLAKLRQHRTGLLLRRQIEQRPGGRCRIRFATVDKKGHRARGSIALPDRATAEVAVELVDQWRAEAGVQGHRLLIEQVPPHYRPYLASLIQRPGQSFRRRRRITRDFIAAMNLSPDMLAEFMVLGDHDQPRRAGRPPKSASNAQ